MENTCPICLDSLQDKSTASPDICDHVFCFVCLSKWSKLGSYCPVDRKRYKKIRNLCSDNVIQVKPRKRKKARILYDISAHCEICLQSNNTATLLLCDCCDLAYHCHCLTPPLKAVPAGLWFCPTCVAVEERLKKRKGVSKEAECWEEAELNSELSYKEKKNHTSKKINELGESSRSLNALPENENSSVLKEITRLHESSELQWEEYKTYCLSEKIEKSDRNVKHLKSYAKHKVERTKADSENDEEFNCKSEVSSEQFQAKVKYRKNKRSSIMYEVAYCEICLKYNKPATLMLCDCCGLGYHCHCLQPNLLEIPSGIWFCPTCMALEERLIEKKRICKEIESSSKTVLDRRAENWNSCEENESCRTSVKNEDIDRHIKHLKLLCVKDRYKNKREKIKPIIKNDKVKLEIKKRIFSVFDPEIFSEQFQPKVILKKLSIKDFLPQRLNEGESSLSNFNCSVACDNTNMQDGNLVQNCYTAKKLHVSEKNVSPVQFSVFEKLDDIKLSSRKYSNLSSVARGYNQNSLYSQPLQKCKLWVNPELLKKFNFDKRSIKRSEQNKQVLSQPCIQTKNGFTSVNKKHFNLGTFSIESTHSCAMHQNPLHQFEVRKIGYAAKAKANLSNELKEIEKEKWKLWCSSISKKQKHTHSQNVGSSLNVYGNIKLDLDSHNSVDSREHFKSADCGKNCKGYMRKKERITHKKKASGSLDGTHFRLKKCNSMHVKNYSKRNLSK